MYRARFTGNIVGSAVESFEQVDLTYIGAVLVKILKLCTSHMGISPLSGWQHTFCAAAACAGIFPEMWMHSAGMEVDSSR